MAIRDETERIHEVLGPIRFDDGKGDPKFGTQDGSQCWLARPMGWLSHGVEIELSGDSSGPTVESLNRAIQAFNSVEKIEKEGRDLIRPIILNTPSAAPDVSDYEAELLWIDCKQIRATVVFAWAGSPYVKWTATLNAANDLIDLEETFW
jgi:hypothetical protein